MSVIRGISCKKKNRRGFCYKFTFFHMPLLRQLLISRHVVMKKSNDNKAVKYLIQIFINEKDLKIYENIPPLKQIRG